MARSEVMSRAAGVLILCSLVVSSSAVSPAVFWSNSRSAQISTSIAYESVSSTLLPTSVFNELSESSQSSSQLFVLFLGHAINGLDLSTPHNTPDGDDSLATIKTMLQSTNVSTVFPYVRDISSVAATTASFLQPVLSEEESVHDVAVHTACGFLPSSAYPVSSMEDIQHFLNRRAVQQSDPGVGIIVYCTQPVTSDSNVASTAVAVEQEGSELKGLVSLVAEHSSRHSFLYAPVGEESSTVTAVDGLEGEGKRRLLASLQSTNSTSCGAACKTRSGLLEGLMASILLLVIFISGIACLSGIDSPSRFETPRESS